MAETKSDPAPAGRKSAPQTMSRPAAGAAAQPDEEMRRLLREAAWTRMFGKTGTKNPFGRRGG